MKNIFIVSLVGDLKISKDSSIHAVGWEETLAEAIKMIETENLSDAYNTYDVRDYPYAIIEEKESGLFSGIKNRWAYQYNEENHRFYPIDMPKEWKHITQFGMG